MQCTAVLVHYNGSAVHCTNFQNNWAIEIDDEVSGILVYNIQLWGSGDAIIILSPQGKFLYWQNDIYIYILNQGHRGPISIQMLSYQYSKSFYKD